MKFEIKHRWSGAVLFSAETETFKAAVELAIKSEANLSRANLFGANLFGANLSRANLSEANLSRANLSDANLSDANLSRANLFGANLSDANLFGANLSDANLSRRQLRSYKHDVWGILLHAIPEIPALRQALIDGKVNGSVYEGDCACLCGTIANARKCKVEDLEGIQADSSSPAEQWFMGIKTGDTPETNGAAKLAVEWIDEFVSLLPKQ